MNAESIDDRPIGDEAAATGRPADSSTSKKK